MIIQFAKKIERASEHAQRACEESSIVITSLKVFTMFLKTIPDQTCMLDQINHKPTISLIFKTHKIKKLINIFRK